MNRFSLALLTVLLGLTGCGGGGDVIPTAAVSGKVTWNGTPLEAGVIRFLPDVNADGTPLSGQMVESPITDGTYQIERSPGAVVGKNKVSIMAMKMVGKESMDGVEVDKVEQYLPAKYNSETTLSVEIQSGSNEHNFELTAQ